MKPPRLLLLVSFAAIATHLCAGDQAGETALPTPPMQGKPWMPPAAKLSAIMVNSIKELFDQGLADPRGCEYREVEIDLWGNGQKQKVHAWVLPGDGKIRYAVGWNGRVNAVTSIGDAVDLRKDFSAETHGLGQFGMNQRWRMHDFQSLRENAALPIKVALLLRLGEADLAEGVWNEGYKGNANMLANDPYSEMAREWLDSWYERAIGALLNGDDHLALAMFRALAPLRKKVQAAGDEHGVTGLQPGQHYLDELEQLDDLAADQVRRAKEPPHVPALQANLPEGPERIAALIRDLELVHGQQMMNPGQTELTFDPIVQALIKEGEPAVEPLIACLDEDPPRMTHTMFTQGMIGEGPVEYVYESADVILSSILKVTITVPEPQGTNPHQLPLDVRKALAAKFREYWAAHKNISPAERWFATLEDDNAAPAEWLQATGNITQRIDEMSIANTQFGGTGWSGGGSGKAPMHGEELRNKSNPSVSDLLIKRFNEMLPTGKRGNGDLLAQLGTLLDQLADWDGKERLGDLRDLMEKFDKAFGYVEAGFTCTAKIDAGLFQKRLDAGDPSALGDYSAWISAFPPDLNPNPGRVSIGFPVPADSYGDVFHILWQHPGDPAIQKAVEKMFGGEDAPWRVRNQYGVPHLLNTPMLGFTSFRQQALAGLDDAKVIGVARKWPSGVFTRMNDEEPDPDPPQNPPPAMEVRVCDYYANQLANAEIFPACELDWPKEKRDAAVVADKALLKQYGAAFQFHAPQLTRFAANRINGSTQLWFPNLDHPATPQDVSQGRAIFSLEGKVRVWPIPVFPLYAERPSSRQDPVKWGGAGPNGETKYITDGYVWQAEEVLVDGKWERYYGFTGRHQIDKVAASEITFPAGAPWTWTPVTAFFDGAIDLPDNKLLRRAGYSSYVGDAGTPLIVMFKAHNHSGLDQQLPAPLALPSDAVKTLPPGIVLHLSYSGKINPDLANPPAQPESLFAFGGGKPPFDYGAWSELPLKKEIAMGDGKTPGPMVGAGGDITLLQIDLREYFDMTKPGTYRLETVFQKSGNPPASAENRPPNTITITVLDKTK